MRKSLGIAFMLVMISCSYNKDLQRYNNGKEFFHKGDYVNALEKLIKIGTKHNIDSLYYFRALSYYHLNEYDNFLSDVFLFNNYSKSAELLQNIGDVYFKSQKYDSALFYSKKAYKIDSNLKYLNYNLGLIYFTLNEYPVAIKYCDKEIKLNPKDYSSFFVKANSLLLLGLINEAEITVNEGLSINPDDANGYFIRGMIEFRNNNYLSSFFNYSKSIRLDSTNEYCYFKRSMTLYKLGYYDKAIKDAKKALKLNPNFYDAFHSLTLSYLAIGDTINGCSNFFKSLQCGDTTDFYLLKNVCRKSHY